MLPSPPPLFAGTQSVYVTMRRLVANQMRHALNALKSACMWGSFNVRPQVAVIQYRTKWNCIRSALRRYVGKCLYQ